MAERPSFNPRRSPVTAGTIAGAVVLSLALWAGKDMSWAMEDGPPIWRGELWRLLTATFLHVNVIHLAFNVYWLAVFGAAIEEWLGSLKTLLLYVLLALSSSAADFLISEGGIGLSGVVYGYFGLLYAVGGMARGPRFQLNPKVTQLFVAWFFLCIVMTYAQFMPVANVAHGAGAVAGYAIGRAFLSQRRPVWLGAIIAATLAVSLLTVYMPWRYEWWWARGSRLAEARDTAPCREYLKRAIDMAGDDSRVSELFLPLADKEARAGNLIESDALIARGVRVAAHPESLRAWQAYHHWSIGDTTKAARCLSGVRLVDLDEELRAIPQFVRFVERTIRKAAEQTSTEPASEPEAD